MNAVSVLIDVEIEFFLGFLYIGSENMPYCAVPECTNGTSGRNKSRVGIKHHCFPKEREEAAGHGSSLTSSPSCERNSLPCQSQL